MRTTVIMAGAVEHTPARTTAVLVVAVVVEHDERQLELFAGSVARPPVKVLDVAPVLEMARAA